MAQVCARRAAKSSNGSKGPTSTTKTSAQGKDKTEKDAREQTREPLVEKRVSAHPPAKAKSAKCNIVNPQAVVDQEWHTSKKIQKMAHHVTPVDENNDNDDQEGQDDCRTVVYRESKKTKATTATRGASDMIHLHEQHTSRKTQKTAPHVTLVDEDNANVDQEDQDDHHAVIYWGSKKTKATRGASDMIHSHEQHTSRKTQKTARHVTLVDEGSADIDQEDQDDRRTVIYQESKKMKATTAT